MMNEMGLRRTLHDHSSGSGHSFGTIRHPSIIDPILSKRVCFYKSGDPQFNGLRMVINNRTFKTFDALLDSLSKKVPLPFGVRNITTPRGVHAIYTLDELEDGKSYICSDNRKVKPINLALARKKLPPWYHARPVSSRRRTIQQAKLFPGQNLHRNEPMVVRTPKRLLVFRNGDPTIRNTVVLLKRTTPTFESILEYISELLQFCVVKLHTPDGRRVDGLPGLILCSGTVVAAGKEPFRPANYNAQQSPPTTMLPTNRMSLRRLKAFNRKKKFLSYTSKSRKFSPSSERYIVNRIHDSIAESSCDLQSNPTNSVELESGHILESVAETEGDVCLGNATGGQDCLLPTEDDIEKSFRVNQDGSMTVEMKVRLTIKEEETIHWTTTLSRSSVANQLNADCLPEPEEEQEISSLKSNSQDLQSPAASIDTINKDKTEDNNDEDPPSMGSGAFSQSSNEEDNTKVQMDMVSLRRAPTPGHTQIRKKQASLESMKSVTAEGIQEGMIGSYSYREQTENGAMTERYCMVKQSSTKPVPKPRRLGSVDVNNINSRNVTTFKSAGLTEILQIESSEEGVTETVSHIYEQQTCQDNFLVNRCAEGTSASGIPFYRPATSGTGQLSYNNEFEPELWRPSTASESISIWRAESLSVTSDLTLPSLNTCAIQATNAQQQFPKPTKGKDKPQQREVNKDKRVSLKPKVVNKGRRRGKRQKENSAGANEKRKKVKTFSSAGFIKKIYGNKSKSPKRMIKLKKGPTQNGEGGVKTKSLQQSDDTIKCSPNIPSALKENPSETVFLEKIALNVAPNEVSQPRGILTRQTSMHQEKKNENQSYDVSEGMSLPAFNSSSSVTNEYVENWLEKAHLNPTAYKDEESRKIEAVTLVQTENGRCGGSENNNDLMIVAEEVKCLEEKSEIQTCQTLKTDQLPENVQGASVKQRIKSFENKSSSPPMEKTTANQHIVNSHTTTTDTENYNGLAQNNIQEIKPLAHHYSSDIIPPTNQTSTEMPSGSEVDNRSSPIKISLQKTTLSNTLSMELPLPPPPDENMELSNTEYYMMDVTSAASSPLYRLSSLSSQMSDNHPLSISPTFDRAISPTDHTMEMTTSVQTDITSTLGEAPLPRTQSVKRPLLVSNLSLDRKMSLRKACLDKYTLCGDATSGTTTSSSPINIVGDNVLPNDICSTGTQQLDNTPHEETQQSNIILDLINSPSCCTSASPTSLTSEERMSSVSILSSEAPTPHTLPFKETKLNKAPLSTQKEASSRKPLVKRVNTKGSPSPERKTQTKKVSSELPQISLGIQKHATSNASPSTERKQMLNKPKLQKRLSPYSQSLDIGSPPVRHKSSRKMLSRNLSSDNASESTTKTQRNTSLERKHHPKPKSIKSINQSQKSITAEPDKTLTSNTLMPLEADKSDANKVNKKDDLITADQERSMAETQIMPKPLNIANQPNMKPVLEEICYSIKSIRQITQNKHPSCLEKSNSLPDFSSHVASTFGSSSKALLAFLSVMTLKEGITNLNMDELNANNVSCAEALRMIDSLREIATIEDSHKLKVSLSNLQQSASKQLLQSWKGFQELSDKCKSRSSTPDDSEQELITKGSPERDIDQNVIDEIMDNLDIPEKLKEELASLSVVVNSDSDDKEQMSARIIEKVELSQEDNSNAKISHFSTEDVVQDREVIQDEKPNVDVSAIIKKFTDINQPKQSSTDIIRETVKQTPTDQATEDKDSKYGMNGVCPPAEPNDEQMHEERQLYSTLLFVKENGEGMQSCRDSVNQENQGEKEQQQGHDEDNHEQDSCTSDVEEKDMEGHEHIHDDESGSEQEGHDMSSANKDLEQKVSCEESVSSSEAGEQHFNSSGEEPEVEFEERQQESKESDDLSNPESHSEEEEDKQPSSNYYVELNVREKGRISSPASPSNSEEEQQSPAGSIGSNASVDESACTSDVNEPSSEEEQPEVECTELSNKDPLSNPASPTNPEKEQQSQAGSIGSNASVDESACTSDLDEPSSEEEQPEVECTELSNKDPLSNPASQAYSEKEHQSPAGSIGSNASVDESACTSDVNEPSSEEEQTEVECTELSNKDPLSNPASPTNSEKEQQSPAGSIGSNASVDESACTSDVNEPSSEEEQTEVECTELSNKDPLSNPASPTNSEKEQQSPAGSIGSNASVDESAFSSDSDEPSSEEEQPEVEWKELKVDIEECLSGNQEEQESMEEEEHLDDLLDQTKKGKELKALIEEEEEDDTVSLDDEDHHADKSQMCDKTKSQDTSEGDPSNLIENQDSYTKKVNSSLIKSDSLTKPYRFNADKDSGNEHSSCEEHVEVEQPKVEDEQINSSNEDELSYYEKEFSSEEEHGDIATYIEESCTEYQQAPALAPQFEFTKCEKAAEKVKHPSEEIISQSIAERVLLLEKQATDAQKKKNTTERSPMRRFSQRNAPLKSDVEDSHSKLPTSESTFSTRSAPQSSLSFSYDSSGVITTEPEGNRVRSIREMFLAKSATDTQYRHRPFPSPNTSALSQLRAETSASGGYQSQSSSELSSGEDDSARKSITKGFVRRAIERLYGKKDVNPDEETSERPPSAPKQKKKEHSSIFSPFHIGRSKAMSELSYFNSTNALDTLTEATRCITFNTQVGPRDSIPIDNEQWLLRENTLIRKSVSDPVGIHKAFTSSPQGESRCEDTEENTPYSLFSTKSDLDDKKTSFSRKCTYFSLPHASDSEACQDDPSTVSKGTVNTDSIIDTKDNSEDTKLWAERNDTLPGVGVTDFKMMDNKVHPLIEFPPDGEVVVVQPRTGQGVMNRRFQEPDMLDLLYNFCGQNCPIL